MKKKSEFVVTEVSIRELQSQGIDLSIFLAEQAERGLQLISHCATVRGYHLVFKQD
jgi:hypothetical protein